MVVLDMQEGVAMNKPVKPVNAVYLKASPGLGIGRLRQSAYTTVLAGFVSLSDSGGGVVEGPMADAVPADWIDSLRAAGKQVLFCVGGKKRLPANLDVLYESAVSTRLSQRGYSRFLTLLQALLKGGKVMLETRHGKPFCGDYGSGFDGIDFNLHNFESYTFGPNSDLWADKLSTLNLALRDDLGEDIVITHSPETPYMLSAAAWPTAHGSNQHALYSRMMQDSGDVINWLNIRLYNLGDYTVQAMLNITVAALLDWARVTGTHPHKLVLSLCLSEADCASGYICPDMLKSALQTLHITEFGGLTGWSFTENETVHPCWDRQFAGMLTAFDA